jgi:septation ring formation regulator EzrA
MNLELKLFKLQENVRYFQWLFDISNPTEARKRMEMLKSAKENLKNFKKKHYPQLLEQPKNNFPKEPFKPMSEWSEKFEEYEF